MKHLTVCKCKDAKLAPQNEHIVPTGPGEGRTKQIATDHHVERIATSVGKPEFFENQRGETVMSFRLFRQASFEALCAHVCGGRLSKAAS